MPRWTWTTTLILAALATPCNAFGDEYESARTKFRVAYAAAQAGGDSRGEAAENLALGIHEIPSVHDVAGLGGKRFHVARRQKRGGFYGEPQVSVKPLYGQKKAQPEGCA